MDQGILLQNRTLFRGMLGMILVALVIGSIGMVIRFSEGLRVTNLGSIIPWGLWVGFYIYFIGLSAGSFLLSTLVYVFRLEKYEPLGRLALFQALICLVIGLLFVFIDLGHPWRFYMVYISQNWHSVLEWEIHFYLLYIVLLAAELHLVMREDFRLLAERKRGVRRFVYRLLSLWADAPTPRIRERAATVLKVCGIIGIPTAIAVHGGTGAIFAVVKARPYWYSSLFPVIFLVSALVSGGGLMLFLRAFFFSNETPEERDMLAGLGKMTGGLLALDLLLLSIETLVGFYGDIPEHVATLRMIMFNGRYAWAFWILQVAIGTILPLIIFLSGRASRSVAALGFAGLSIVVGIVSVRMNIVIPALALAILPGLTEAYHNIRLDAVYAPSLVEWLTTIFALGLFALLLVAGLRLLPLGKNRFWQRATLAEE
ncbi:MAG: polysulfide reductase NrfD [Candidatus Tectomicrobia bacterium]|nr:polysulfide reductase NrfD [Candidatus Tectomicrobia bacterium]